MKKYLGFISLFLAGLIVLAPALASADTTKVQGNPPAWANGQPGGNGRGLGMGGDREGMMKPAIFGTVTAVSGNTSTVSGKTGFGKTASATTTYSVDATNAKISKNNASSSISAIVVGDTVLVQGTITGTNVVATMIRDGVVPGPRGGMMGGKPDDGSTTPVVVGNGQPVVAGNITAIGSSTITVTNKSNVVYTVDVSTAKIVEGQNTIGTIANLKVGDNVLVQGAVNGTSISAYSVIDQTAPATGNNPRPHPGFFGGIGQFFMHMFGF